MRIMRLFSAIIVILCLGGCATKTSMLNAPLDAGRSQTFSSDYDTVVKAARDALMSSGLAIDDASEVSNKTFVILAKKGSSAWSAGELVRVTVQEVNESETTVRVYTKRKVTWQLMAKGDWADTVLSNIALQLR